MRRFTLICALFLLLVGAAAYYGWGLETTHSPGMTSAMPAAIGAAMFAGALVAIFLRRTGLQFASLAALTGVFAGLGRLAPSYLDASLEWTGVPARSVAPMIGICLLYLVATALRPLFRKKKKTETAPEAPGMEGGQSLEIP